LTPTEEAAVSGLLPNTGSATVEMAGKFENLTTETETKPIAPATRKTRQTRTSQRQLDRELKEEAERIRKENQLLLKKEKEAMKKHSLGQSKIESDELMTPDDSIENTNNQIQTPIISPEKATVTPTTASGR
jgi:thiol:disulfide interchange protein